MPVHTYHCEECDHEFDAHQAFDEDSLTVCPNCGKEALYKIYKPALVLFKGSGFYVTDTKSSSPTLSKGSNHKAGSNGSKEETKKESTKTETQKSDKKEN